MRKLLLLILLLALANISEAKVRTVRLLEEIKNASFIDTVEILSYNAITYDSVDVKILNTGQTLRVFYNYGGWFEDKYTTNYVPEIGEKVVLLLGPEGRLSLFAKKIELNYRFWSPLQTGSSAGFVISPPIKVALNTSLYSINKNVYCHDACLYPIDSLIIKNKLSNISGKYHRILSEDEVYKMQVKKINTYLSNYAKMNPFGDYFTALDFKKLGFKHEEVEAIKKEDLEFSKNKDSIESAALIMIYQDKIIETLEEILTFKKLIPKNLNTLFHEELAVISSPDNKLFNFSLFGKTGGTYRSRISLMYYSESDSIYNNDFFEPDGYGIIDTLNTDSGIKYLLQGSVRGCSYCFTNHISLIQFRENEFHWDFHYEFSSRDWNDEVIVDSTKRNIKISYHLNDLTETCSCEKEDESSEFNYDSEKEYLCQCVFRFNGETFEIIKKIEKKVIEKE